MRNMSKAGGDGGGGDPHLKGEEGEAARISGEKGGQGDRRIGGEEVKARRPACQARPLIAAVHQLSPPLPLPPPQQRALPSLPTPPVQRFVTFSPSWERVAPT